MLQFGDLVKVGGRFWAFVGIATDKNTGQELAILEKVLKSGVCKRKFMAWDKIELTQPSDYITA